MHFRDAAREGAGGAAAPQILADQLTLSQPGGLIMPTTVLRAPSPDFQTLRRPSCHVLVNSKIVMAMFVSTLCAMICEVWLQLM